MLYKRFHLPAADETSAPACTGMNIDTVVPIIGPPASGKSTLAATLAYQYRFSVFRLRHYVPAQALEATATTAHSGGWIDDVTVAGALVRYFGALGADGARTVVMDNFPGSAATALAHIAAGESFGVFGW